jgi:hypothetical protein
MYFVGLAEVKDLFQGTARVTSTQRIVRVADDQYLDADARRLCPVQSVLIWSYAVVDFAKLVDISETGMNQLNTARLVSNGSRSNP